MALLVLCNVNWQCQSKNPPWIPFSLTITPHQLDQILSTEDKSTITAASMERQESTQRVVYHLLPHSPTFKLWSQKSPRPTKAVISTPLLRNIPSRESGQSSRARGDTQTNTGNDWTEPFLRMGLDVKECSTLLKNECCLIMPSSPNLRLLKEAI